MTIKEMEDCGVFEYFSNLISFISRFLEKNHPITDDDLKAILLDQTTENLDMRRKVLTAMQEKLKSIIEKETKNNKRMIEEFRKNPDRTMLNKDFIAERNQKIQKYMDEILEARWEVLNVKEETSKLGNE